MAKKLPAIQPASAEVLAYLEGVVGVVEANSFESMCLWQNSRERERSWSSTGHGYGPCIGRCAGMPVHLSLMTATVDGHKILFIDAMSQVVDYRLVDAWLEQSLPRSAFKVNAPAIINKTDAMNFANVFPHPSITPSSPSTGTDEPEGDLEYTCDACASPGYGPDAKCCCITIKSNGVASHDEQSNPVVSQKSGNLQDNDAPNTKGAE